MNVFRQVSLADSLSVLNALFGFSAITYILLHGIRSDAFTLFYLAILADGTDGLVASKTEKSPFGKELDSLADAISFGLFPAVVMVKYQADLFPFAALIVAFSILRLARFNVVKFENFYGLPTLVCAIILTSLIRLGLDPIVIAAFAVVLSVLMVSDIVYPRIRDPYALLAMALVILAAIVFDEMNYVILVLALIYTAQSPVREVVVRWRRLHLKRE